jgi:hypothetical protein
MRESFGGRGNSVFGFCFTGFRDFGDDFTGSRVEHIKGRVQRFPDAVDQIAGLKKDCPEAPGSSCVLPF